MEDKGVVNQRLKLVLDKDVAATYNNTCNVFRVTLSEFHYC
jgi:hypothetical protein